MSVKIKTTILKPKEMFEYYDSHFWHPYFRDYENRIHKTSTPTFNQEDYLKYCLSDYHGLDEVLKALKAENIHLHFESYCGLLSDFNRMVVFKTKDELLEAIKYRISQYKKGCSYCSGELQYEIHNILWQEIIYKVPPPGARDLRIIAGTRWVPIAHESHKCSKCGAVASYWIDYIDYLEIVPEKPKKKRSLLDSFFSYFL